VNSWRQGFPDFRRWAFNSFELRLPDDRSNCYSAFWELWPPVSVEVLEFSKETNPPLWTSRLQIRSSPPSSPGDAVLMASRVKPSD
jgi:hypothetical protein